MCEIQLLQKLNNVFELCTRKNITLNSGEDYLGLYHKIVDSLDDETFRKSFVKDILGNLDRFEYSKELLSTYSKEWNCSKIDIEMTENIGLGIYAKEEISKDTNFVEIPSSVTLSVEDFKNHIEYSLFYNDPEYFSNSNSFFAFCILMEFYNGEDSPFWLYLRSLPTIFNNITNFTPNDFDIMISSNYLKTSLSTWISLIRQYAHLHLRIITSLSTNAKNKKMRHTLVSRKVRQRFCLNDYLWAAGVIMSRNFPKNVQNNESICLVPLLDLFNHDSSRDQAYFEVNRDQYVGFTSSKIEKSSKICINYGNCLDADSVIYRGFFPFQTKDKSIEINCSFRSHDKCLPIKLKLAGKLGISLMMPLIITETSFWVADNLVNARLFAANKEECDRLINLSPVTIRDILTSEKGLSTRNENLASLVVYKCIQNTIIANESLINKLQDISPISQIQSNLLLLHKSDIKLLQISLEFLVTKFPNIKN